MARCTLYLFTLSLLLVFLLSNAIAVHQSNELREPTERKLLKKLLKKKPFLFGAPRGVVPAPPLPIPGAGVLGRGPGNLPGPGFPLGPGVPFVPGLPLDLAVPPRPGSLPGVDVPPGRGVPQGAGVPPGIGVPLNPGIPLPFQRPECAACAFGDQCAQDVCKNGKCTDNSFASLRRCGFAPMCARCASDNDCVSGLCEARKCVFNNAASRATCFGPNSNSGGGNRASGPFESRAECSACTNGAQCASGTCWAGKCVAKTFASIRNCFPNGLKCKD